MLVTAIFKFVTGLLESYFSVKLEKGCYKGSGDL